MGSSFEFTNKQIAIGAWILCAVCILLAVLMFHVFGKTAIADYNKAIDDVDAVNNRIQEQINKTKDKYDKDMLTTLKGTTAYYSKTSDEDYVKKTYKTLYDNKISALSKKDSNSKGFYM